MLYPEQKCHRCGECCRLKVKIGKRRVVLNLYCPAMDVSSKACMIYDWRHRKRARELRGGRDCVSVWKGLWRGLYPKSCAYVRWYHPHSEYEQKKTGLISWKAFADILASTNAMRRRIKQACEE